MGMNNQILHLAGRFLNTFNQALPGESVAGPSEEKGRFFGQIGACVVLREGEAVKYSDTTVGTLHGGVYQLVQTKAGSTIAPARGLLAHWDPASAIGDFVVTPDIQVGAVAGVYISAPTKGNYCIIQVQGLATVQCLGTVTKGTPAVGDFGTVAVGSTVDVLADATAITNGNINDSVCIFEEVPTNGGLKLAYLVMRRFKI